jgi:hypothetical protein
MDWICRHGFGTASVTQLTDALNMMIARWSPDMAGWSTNLRDSQLISSPILDPIHPHPVLLTDHPLPIALGVVAGWP